MKTLKTRKDHKCEQCQAVIPQGTIAVVDKLLDWSKSFTGGEYLAYYHSTCYKLYSPQHGDGVKEK